MKTILVIDDDEFERGRTAQLLRLASYQVYTAESGKSGVELAQLHKPGLIICDVMMPELDGYGVLHLLGKNAQTAGIPFIFLTSKTDHLDVRKGMELGADDYITKPFNDTELLNAIEGRFKKSELLHNEQNDLHSFFDSVAGIDELKKLAENKKTKTYKKKEIIFSEGMSPAGVYLVHSGKIKAYKTHELGKELIIDLYNKGDFFGYIPLLEERTHNETAEALEETELVMVPKEDFFTLIYGNTVVMKKFIRLLSDSVADKEEQLIRLAYSSVRKRVAEALLLLEKRYAENTGEKFSIAVSREDLANIVGTATESLIRTLSDFKHEKLIGIKGSMITILDHNGLVAIRN
jgi:CRP-like cAMP-binding protein/ActR/RegA family two-component response regulator